MAGPILFKLGTHIVHYGIHMHVNLFCDRIQFSRLVAILFFSHNFSHNSDKAQAIVLILSTNTIYYDRNMYMDLFCHMIKYGRLAAILFSYHIAVT